MHINEYLGMAFRNINQLFGQNWETSTMDSRVLAENEKAFNERKEILNAKLSEWRKAIANVASEGDLYQFVAIFNGCGTKISKPDTFKQIIDLADQLIGVLNRFEEDGNPQIHFE